MLNFNLNTCGRIIFGRGRLGELSTLGAGFGRRAALVTGRQWLEQSGRLDQIAAQFRAADLAWHHERVGREPTVEAIDAATERVREFGAELVIAVGGGSVLDSGKAIAALITNGGSALDYLEGVGHGQCLEHPALPCIAVPTTSGTGSEATNNAVIRDEAGSFKKSMRSDRMLPMVALIDPALTDNCPPNITAASGLDAITQLLEAYTGQQANPISDALAITGLAHASALHRAVEIGDDHRARDEMALASLLSGVCLTNVGLGVIHALASPIGALYEVPHGVICAKLLPEAIRLNHERVAAGDGASSCLEKYRQANRMLFGALSADETGSPQALAWRLQKLNRQFGLRGLGRYGVKSKDFERIVDHAGASNLRNNPAELTREDLLALLEAVI